jgi:flavodoxin
MVIYDSLLGNTAKIAQAISNELSDTHSAEEDVELHRNSEIEPGLLEGFNLLIVGSPTHKFRPPPTTSAFLNSISKNALKGTKVAAFDTRFTEEEIDSTGWFFSAMVGILGFAAEPIANKLQKKGGELAIPAEGFYVDGFEGPLSEGELKRAAEWARQILPVK